MKNPKITVLLSAYNGEKVLEKCLKSIFNQTYKNIDLVCLDDFSADSTFKIMKKWEEKVGKKKMKIVKNKKNLGVPKSSNKGIRLIKSDYIARIDADDYWEKNKIEKQVNFIKKNPDFGVIGCNHVNFYENNKNKKFIKLPKNHEEISSKLFRKNPFAHSCVLMKTDLVKKIGGYNEKMKYGSDYDIYLRLFPYTKFHNIQEFLCYRLMMNSGISIKKQNAQMLQSIKTRSKYILKYKYSLRNFIYLWEPLVVILTPTFIKNIKRKYF